MKNDLDCIEFNSGQPIDGQGNKIVDTIRLSVIVSIVTNEYTPKRLNRQESNCRFQGAGSRRKIDFPARNIQGPGRARPVSDRETNAPILGEQHSPHKTMNQFSAQPAELRGRNAIAPSIRAGWPVTASCRKLLASGDSPWTGSETARD